MSKAWKWEKVGKTGSEYKLKDSWGLTVGYISLNFDGRWFCSFHDDDLNMNFCITLVGMKNAEEALQTATVWICDKCDEVIRNFSRIRESVSMLDEEGLPDEDRAERQPVYHSDDWLKGDGEQV